MSFPVQKKLPKKGNKYYNTTGVGGYSHCIVGKPTQSGLNVLDNCFAGETKYITSEGLKTFYDTVGTIQNVLNENGEFVPAEIKSFGIQQLYEIEFSNGFKVYATGNHRWVVDRTTTYNEKKYFKRKIKTTIELTKTDDIPYNYYNGNDLLDKQGILHGLVYGDGYKNNNCNTYKLQLFGNKQELNRYIPEHIVSDYNLKEVPSIYESEEYLRGFIAGLIATDGTITEDTFKISSINLNDLEQIKNICYKIGIAMGGIYSETRDVKLGEYEYLDHTIYYLTFKRRNIEKLLLKKTDIDKITKEQKEIKYTHIKSIKLTDREEEVFCAVEPLTHTITLEKNILTGQCVGWSCSRFNEVYSYLTGYKGMKYYQLNCDAEKFINRAKAIGLKTQKEPITGGIMVWQKGSTLHHDDGAGHVAFVEERRSKTNVYTSESGYNSFAFANKTRTKGDGNWGTGKGYKYLGCIIDPAMTKDTIDVTEELQHSLNKQWKCGLKEDGVWGKATEAACNKHHLYLGIKGETVKWLQTRLIELGYNVGKSKVDGSFGFDTEKAVKQFQKDHGLKVDGRVGVKTYKALTE